MSRLECNICRSAKEDVVPVRSSTHRHICVGCLELLRFLKCTECGMWTDPKIYNFRKKMCAPCVETRHRKKHARKRKKNPARMTPSQRCAYIESLEKRVKRLLLQGKNELAISETPLLIAELRDIGRHERADQLELVLNQFHAEIGSPDTRTEPDVMKKN